MIDDNTHIVFDLDDTLYKEIDYVKSAYVFICNYLEIHFGVDLSANINYCITNNNNFFDFINSNLPTGKSFNIEKYLELYRFHSPNISLPLDTQNLLEKLDLNKIDYSIITDGRSISQRNKISSLGLSTRVKKIIISDETGYEKPHIHNFKDNSGFISKKRFVYVGDNTIKDFIAPNILNWDTICLIDNGKNIHKQNFELEKKYLPSKKINYLNEII